MIAWNRKTRCTIFAQIFGHFRTRKNCCDIVSVGERKLRKDKTEQIKSECKNLAEKLKIVERQIGQLERESEKENQMRHLARLIFAGKIIEKSGLLYSFNEQSLCEFLTANKSKLEKRQNKILKGEIL